MIGQTVSHYRILEELGGGGMGVVYKAEDTKLKRVVALKFLPPELTRDQDAKTRFIHEAQAASALQHHNICTIHEIDETPDGRLFIAMDCYEGETLKERIARGPLPVDDAIDIANQVAEGLAKAHGAGMVHRDIKPANIVITTDGVVKILDFGLAKLEGQTKVTKTGTTVGTVAYMSPEQTTGKEIDQRSDIFSLGAVLYEMLVGEVPFKGDHEAAVLYGVMHNDPEPVSKYRTDVPGEMTMIINTALRKDPEGRYQNASDLAVDLARFRGGVALAGHPLGVARRSRRRILSVAAMSIMFFVAGYFLYSWFLSSRSPDTSPTRKMIVVLPFDNLGPAEDEYFADGITEEITSRLAAVQELGIIARTSAMQYKKAGKTIGQIGEELGVDYVLEGSVRWDRDSGEQSRVRITPQLIQVADATHLWSESYDRVIDDIFMVQSDIAEKVIDQLGATLLMPKSGRAVAQPTDNLEAYTYYLRGRDFQSRGLEEDNTRKAIQMFERAINLDSTFALAYAELGIEQTEMYWFYYDRTDERLNLAKAAVNRAQQLDPDLPEVQQALGNYYYHGELNYDLALYHYRNSLRYQPNNSDSYVGIASVFRRQGKMVEAARNFLEAAKLDPRIHLPRYFLGETYSLLRDYDEAVRQFDLAISLSPGAWGPYAVKSGALVARDGNTTKARIVVRDAEAYVVRKQDIALRKVQLEMLDREYEKALERLSSVSRRVYDGQFQCLPLSQLYAEIYYGMKKPDLAKAQYDSARVLLEAKLEERPDDARYHSALGIAYAGLGRKEDALREGALGVELLPVSKDAWRGYRRAMDLAKICVMTGEHDAAIERLDELLSIPGELSVAILKLDPTWDPLRDHPRFQRLLKMYSTSEY